MLGSRIKLFLLLFMPSSGSITFTLCFAGFLRFNEVSELRTSDIKFYFDYVILHIRHIKTDVYREGRNFHIAKGSTTVCPVAMLQRYMSCSGLRLDSDMYLFRSACQSGSRCFLLRKDKKISYTWARDCIVTWLKLVVPHLNLGTSRASGVTVVANSNSVNERCLKWHGIWKSDTAKYSYIDDSLENKLLVSRQLKL